MADEHWITRGQTIIDWPWIPNKEVKDYLRDFIEGQNTQASLIGFIEDLEDDDPTRIMIEGFMNEYNLDENTIVKFWW